MAVTFKLYDEIGEPSLFAPDAVSAKRVSEFFDGIDADETVDLRIHSPGGNVSHAKAIVSTMRNHAGTINGHIDGLAASAASWIAVEADTLTVNSLSEFFVHDVMRLVDVFGYFNAEELEKAGEVLLEDSMEVDRSSQVLADLYAKRTGIDLDEMRGMMKNETLLVGDEIRAKGFATAFVDTKPRDQGDEEMAKRFFLDDENMLRSRFVSPSKRSGRNKSTSSEVEDLGRQVIELKAELARREKVDVERKRMMAAIG